MVFQESEQVVWPCFSIDVKGVFIQNDVDLVSDASRALGSQVIGNARTGVLVDGAGVGSVAVSGLSQAEDEELARLGIAAM